MKKLLLSLLAAFGFALSISPALASEEGYPWDHFPAEKMTDVAALQHGAKIFVNYCLNCHSAQYMRYNRLNDIGLTDAEIKANMLFATDKVGNVMKTTLDPKQAKEWLGAAPPDLSVIARSRAEPGKGSGADYLYTLWRTFYRDETKPTGWNNLAYPGIAMPHVLWQLQGERRARFIEEKNPHEAGKTELRFAGFEPDHPWHARRPPVRRDHRRPGGLPAVDGRAGPGQARAHRRRRPDLSRPADRLHVGA